MEGYCSFALKTIGAGHVKNNRPCEDYTVSYEDAGAAVIVVCDGHGGEDYMRSGKGAEFAANAAIQCIKEFLAQSSSFQDKISSKHQILLSQLVKSIIAKWNDKVTNDCAQNPFTEAELSTVSERARRRYTEQKRIQPAYGTTLICAVLTERYWFGLHIGDGKCVMLDNDDNYSQPIPWDPNCFLNETTSICDSNAFDECRYFYSETLPQAVFIASDGVDDCFGSDEKLYGFYKAIVSSFTSTPFEDACKELGDYLPSLSAKGSMDDISVAGIIKKGAATDKKSFMSGFKNFLGL